MREDFPQLSKAVIGTYWPPVVVFLVSEAARVVTGATSMSLSAIARTARHKG